jgi:uncharacterized membrane protein
MRDYLFPPLLFPLFLLIILPLFALTLLLASSTTFQILFGIDYEAAITLFALIVIGSFINIPIYEKEGREVVRKYSFFGLLYYVRYRNHITIAVNLGGCVMPSILALKLLTELPALPFAISFAISSAVIYFFARPIEGLGIAVPMFIPPAISALASYLAATFFSLPPVLIPKLAFTSGVLGALFGADILHLKDIERIGSGVVSIGGAGTFDGIFLTGIFAVIFALMV